MLAVIAGSGRLPALVAQAQDTAPLVCALQGFTPENVAADLTFRLETLGSLLADLKARGVTEVCFAGVIRRPEIDASAIDAATAPLMARVAQAIAQGDDGALRVIFSLFEEAGFTIRAVQELVPSLLPEPVILGGREPTDAARADAERGADVIAALSDADIGQACVVLRGQVLAVEGVFGTDWMLASLVARPDAGGGVLVKAPKAGQDRRGDLPTVGVDTVEGAARAALDGIVVEAGGVMVIDRAAVAEACERLGIFLWVRG